MKRLVTTLGLRHGRTDLILPHEHIFVDFRTPDHPAHARAHVAAVVALMAPQLEAARGVGVTVLVDSTPLGVGRRTDAVKAVSDALGSRSSSPPVCTENLGSRPGCMRPPRTRLLTG